MFARTNLMWPVALVVALCLSAQALLFTTLTRAQDEATLAAEQALVATAVESQVQSLRRILKDYAFWDDAYRNLTLSFDREFADANLGPYLAATHGMDYSFVLDGHDRTIYATRGDQPTIQTAMTSLGAPVMRAISEVRRPAAAADFQTAGFTRIHGQLAVFGIAGVTPSPGSDFRADDGPMTLIILVQLLDKPMLDDLARRYRLSTLVLTGDPPEGTANLPLRLFGGEVAGSLAWNPDRPGTRVRNQLLPWLAAMPSVNHSRPPDTILA